MNYQTIKSLLIDNNEKDVVYIMKRDILFSKKKINLTEKDILKLIKLTTNPRIWNLIAKYCEFSSYVLHKLENVLDFKYIVPRYQKLNKYDTAIFMDIMTPKVMAAHQCVSLNYVDRNYDVINFATLSMNENIEINYLEKIIDKYHNMKNISWYALSCRKGLSKDFIIKYIDRLYKAPLTNNLLTNDELYWNDNEFYDFKIKHLRNEIIKFNNDELDSDIQEDYVDDLLNRSTNKNIAEYVIKNFELSERFFTKYHSINEFDINMIRRYQDISDDFINNNIK